MYKLQKFLSGLTVSALVTACTVGPDYNAPNSVVNIALDSEYQTATSVKTWWGAFGDQQLSTLIELALEENRTLREAAANVNRAYAVFSEAGNNRIPSASVTAGYQAGKNSSLLPSDNSTIIRGYTSGLSLSWDADIFGKLRRAEEAALAHAEQADLLWKDAQLQIISQVAASYGEYKGAEIRLIYAEQNLQYLMQSKEIIQAQVNAGSATAFELAQIETQVHRVKTDIPEILIARKKAISTLATLVAKRADELDINNDSGLPNLIQPLPIAKSEVYLKYRPDVASAEREVALSNAQIGIATADLYPSLSFTGFLGFISSPGLNLNGANESWNMAPAVQWTGINYGNVRSRIKQAEAGTEMALARFEQTVIDAVNEMQFALDSYQLSRDRLSSARSQFESSQQAVEIARIRYKAGTVDFLQLLDSERELLTSRDQLAQIELSHFLHLVSVYQSFGGGLEWG